MVGLRVAGELVGSRSGILMGLAVAVLLCAASLVMSVRSGGRRTAAVMPGATAEPTHSLTVGPGNKGGRPTRGGPSPAGGRSEPAIGLGRRIRGALGGAGNIELHELPLFIHQLAGLLLAGRPPHALWADMQSVHSFGGTAFSAAVAPIIAAASRASALGLSVPHALREAAAPREGPRSGNQHELDRLWVDLAGCLEVAERSGAPLAKILEQYAAQLDAHLDGVAARETALAGPRATVVLLAWLPVVGLGLGFGLGINPVELLTTSLLGRLALVAGVLLIIAARVWSRRLIRRAAGITP